MDAPEYFSKGFDHLDQLRTTLADLTGPTVLLHELIQNADDAEGVSEMSIQVDEKALWVRNDASFTDCGHPKLGSCPWLDDEKTACDFHSFRRMAGGLKSLKEDTTGAFGIGFLSVYQITDRPELVSAGRHWKLNELETEKRRIEQCRGCDLCRGASGTLFYLPWARDNDSDLRRRLERVPVTDETIEDLAADFARSLPDTAIFLRRLQEVRLVRDGDVLETVTIDRDDPGLLLVDVSGRSQIWLMIETDFEEEAEALYRRYEGIVRRSRKPLVRLAVPHTEIEGDLYASLPTRDVTKLGFHINAEFFPSSDRKHLHFGNDHRGEWNRAAIRAAGEAFARILPMLTTELDPVHFYSILLRAHRAVNHDLDPVFKVFWTSALPILRESPMAYTSGGAWHQMDDVLSPYAEEDFEAAGAMEAIGLRLVDKSVWTHLQQLPRAELGLDSLGIPEIVSSLTRIGLNQTVPLISSPLDPATLSSVRGILDRMLTRRGADSDSIGSCAIFPSSDGHLRLPGDVYRGDDKTIEFFDSLGTSVPFVEASAIRRNKELAGLVPEFNAEAAVDALTCVTEGHLRSILNDEEVFSRLFGWLEKRIEDLGEQSIERLATLPIFPSGQSFEPLVDIYLPGGFEDLLGLSSVIDLDRLGKHRDFVERLGIRTLDIHTYFADLVPRVAENGSLDPPKRRLLLRLLADNLGKVREDRMVRDALSGLEIIETEAGDWVRPDECYLRTTLVSDILGDVSIARLPPEGQDSFRDASSWLGVEDRPRLGDVLDKLDELASIPVTRDGVRAVGTIVQFLSEGEDLAPGIIPSLTKKPWMPDSEFHDWHLPSDTFFPFQEYLFSTQAVFIGIQRDLLVGSVNTFLEEVGVRKDVPVSLVVSHLRAVAEAGQKVNQEVYTFLDQNAADPLVSSLRGTDILHVGDGRYIRTDHCFIGQHNFGRFRHTLGPSFARYRYLLEALSIADSPSWEDALRVLIDIASQVGKAHLALEDDDKAVVKHCWHVLDEAILSGDAEDSDLAALRGHRVIPDARSILNAPDHMLFDDYPKLSGRFELVRNNLIPKWDGLWRAMEAAGVKSFLSVLSSNAVEAQAPGDHAAAQELIESRMVPLLRVMHDVEGDVRSRLDEIHCQKVKGLRIQRLVKAFNQTETLPPEEVSAFYDARSGILMIEDGTKLPVTSIARELAMGLTGVGGNYAAAIKEVLSASSVDSAHSILDELDFPSLLETGLEGFVGDIVDLGADPEDDTTHYKKPSKSPSEVEEDSTEEPEDQAVEPEDLENAEEPKPAKKWREPSMILRSYVVEGGDVDRDGASNPHHDPEIAEAGVRRVMAYEVEQGRVPTEMPPLNKGFDIRSSSPDGIRFIEVKSIKGGWSESSDASMTKPQFEMAQEEGEAFWLYVVERAMSEDFAIWPIQDPARKVARFIFDDGWASVAGEFFEGG